MSHEIQNQYRDGASRFDRLRQSALSQISELLESNEIPLGVPIESRVKTWASIEEKIQRKELELSDIRDLHDLVGIRIILLFKGDLEKAIALIEKAFHVVSSENAAERLGDAQFGYQSQHIVVKIPEEWLHVPSFASLDDLFIEFQVRTLAQHIWAAVSHKLQYKNEESVPPPIRRSINRASALLETVDLEFERVLEARRDYVKATSSTSDSDAPLNVDSLALLLSEILPERNRKEDEPYADLLHDLSALSITTAPQLRKLVNKHLDYVLQRDAKEVAERVNDPSREGKNADRLNRGVFFAHVGLVRSALRKEFGSDRINEIHTSKNVKKRPTRKAPKTSG